jgi:hypothetical protein
MNKPKTKQKQKNMTKIKKSTKTQNTAYTETNNYTDEQPHQIHHMMAQEVRGHSGSTRTIYIGTHTDFKDGHGHANTPIGSDLFPNI